MGRPRADPPRPTLPWWHGHGCAGTGHHGFTTWLAGGGVKGGYVHGSTDEFGFRAVEKKVHVHDLHATILHLLGFDHTRLTYGKLFEDADKRWQETQSEADRDANAAPTQTLPEGEQEALRQVFYGKDSPGNLPAELMRQLFSTTALVQLGPRSMEPLIATTC